MLCSMYLIYNLVSFWKAIYAITVIKNDCQGEVYGLYDEKHSHYPLSCLYRSE